MKKLLALTLAILILFSFASCNGGESENTVGHEATTPADFTEIRVAVLNGTTGFGIAPLYCDIQNGIHHNMNAKIDFYADATLVAPLVIGGSVDVAAVPTNLAATLYNKTKGGIEVLAVNTLGVLYLIENGSSVKSLSDLEGKTVYLPGSGSNPEFVLRTLLELSGLADKVALDFTYATPDELTAAIASVPSTRPIARRRGRTLRCVNTPTISTSTPEETICITAPTQPLPPSINACTTETAVSTESPHNGPNSTVTNNTGTSAISYSKNGAAGISGK